MNSYQNIPAGGNPQALVGISTVKAYDTFADLPVTSMNGDAAIVIDEQRIYIYDSDTLAWILASGGLQGDPGVQGPPGQDGLDAPTELALLTDVSFGTLVNGDVLVYQDGYWINSDVDVTNEASIRAAADASLTTRISTEEVNRSSADTSLTTRISTETVNRTSGDSSLQTRFSNEVSSEISNRIVGDNSLNTKLSTETVNRISADSSLQTRLSNEESTRLSKDNSLATAISAEVSNSIVVDASLTTRISTEEVNRSSSDSSIVTRFSNEVSAEISNRIVGDSSLTTRLSTETVSRASADSSLQTRFSDEVSVEISNRLSGDSSLTTRLSNEESTRLSQDNSLTTRFSNEVSSEISNRLSGDSSLTTRLSNEGSIRLSADSSLFTSISNEISERISADQSLYTKISQEVSTEISNRVAQDTSLSNQISTEESSRIVGDNSLQTRFSGELSSEISNRIAGDNSLYTAIQGESSNLTTQISSEESSRLSGDNSLQTRISSEESLRASRDSSIVTSISSLQAYDIGHHGSTVDSTLNDLFSASTVNGFAITKNGDGTVNVASGQLYIRTGSSEQDDLRFFGVTGVTNQVLTDNSNNYLYVNYNSGSPVIQVTTSTSGLTNRDKVALWQVVRVGTTLHTLDLRGSGSDFTAKYNNKSHIVEGIKYGFGSVTSETGTRNIAITFGRWYFGITQIDAAALNTSTGGTFTTFYRDGIGGWTRTTGQTQINNTQYDNGTGTLASLGTSKYGVRWIYAIHNNPTSYGMLFGQATHNSVASAEAEKVPSTLPLELQFGSTGSLIARIIIQNNAATFTSIATPFETVFTSSNPTDHNNLSGLQGGTAGEYYHLTSSEHSSLILESSIRVSSDASLQTRISTEESVRASTDTSLTTRLSTEESTRASLISGTNNTIVKYTSTSTIGNSSLTDDGTSVNTNAIVSTSNTTEATSSTTGALKSSGGISAVKNIICGGQVVSESQSVTLATGDTTKTIDFDLGNYVVVTMNNTSSCAITLSNYRAGGAYRIVFAQDSSGSRTITWVTTIKWQGGSVPTITSTANKKSKIQLEYDGTDLLGEASLNY